MNKICNKCKLSKPITDFYKNQRQCICCNKEYYRVHREELRVKSKRYRQIHKQELAANQKLCYARNKERIWKYSIQKTYKITDKQYQALLLAQNNRCAICGMPQEKLNKRLGIDYDHQLQKIRGLLCDRCNRGLGLLRDSIPLLVSATTYLQLHK